MHVLKATLNACLVGAIAAGSLAGCAGSPTGPDMGKLKLKYSEKRFVVGHGVADNRAEAEADARARVAKQVSASLQADLKVKTQESAGSTSVEVDRFIRETSDFDRAELIQLVNAATHCGDGQCTAMAVLSRGEYLDTLAEDYARQRPRFTEAAAGAEGSGEDITQFTRNFRVAMEAYTPLARIARRAKVVAGGGIEGMADDEKRVQGLVGIRARRMSALKVTVLPGNIDNPKIVSAIQQALVTATGELGVTAASGPACDKGLAMVPQGQVDCAQGSLGSRCSLPLTAKLTHCATGAEIAPLDFRQLKLKGAHPKNINMALSALIKKARQAPMTSTLRDQLRTVLPLED